MTEAIDTFCDELRTKLDDADMRLKNLKASVTNASQKAKDDAKAHLDQLESKAKEQQAQIEGSEAKVKEWVQEKKAMTDQKIAEWKSQRQANKLTDRAARAENYADATIEIAVAAIDDAETAVVEAIVARMDADEVQKPAAAKV
jgi:small-conductance mechanosensitive channel